MARIGTTHPQSRIYNLALGRYENEFEMEQIGKAPVNGLTSRQRVSEIPTVQKIIFGGYDAPRFKLEQTEKYFRNFDKTTDISMTEYEKKIGSRSQGSFMEQAQSKPYIEIAGKGLNGDIHGSAPALDLLDDQEQYRLMTVYNPYMQKAKTKIEKKEEEIAKLGQPYKMETLSKANEDPRKFMEMNLQEVELYPSTATNKGDGGSNLAFDYKKELNKDTNPITREALYNENFNNKKAVSNINMMQRDAHTARDVLSTYGNKQHTATVPQEADKGLRPEIMKGEMLEAHQEENVQKEKHGENVRSNLLLHRMNSRNPMRRFY